MYTLERLHVDKEDIDFGIPTNTTEMHRMYELRYDVYTKKDYLSKTSIESGVDRDLYDEDSTTTHLIAFRNGEVIATTRMIQNSILPIQQFFKFTEPEEIQKIPLDQRYEFSRLIVRPYHQEKGYYLPRHVITLLLFDTVCIWSLTKGLKGGLAFIKKSLQEKLNKLNIPIKAIKDYQKRYPVEDKVLGSYFCQQDDPAIPIYFLTEEVKQQIDNILNNPLTFKKVDDGYTLKETHK